jgi:8-oxo-dGTP pyrophosphatase MutT (NUDIX family)
MIVNTDTPNAESVPVRDAATVMLLRDGPSGLEVFMLRRNLNSDFVGGAYVFPGGAIDNSDGEQAVEQYCIGRTDTMASRHLGIDQGGLAFWVGAIRESFEEAGLLFAAHPDGRPLEIDESNCERFTALRSKVDAGEIGLAAVCQQESIRLRVDEMHYWSRWVTPLGAPRRYDTRFFVGSAPTGQTPLHDDHEVIAHLWIAPMEALERHRAGEFELIFPTVRSLESLCGFATAVDAIAHARTIEHVDPIQPKIITDGQSLRIVLPNDEIYDAITSERLS